MRPSEPSADGRLSPLRPGWNKRLNYFETFKVLKEILALFSDLLVAGWMFFYIIALLEFSNGYGQKFYQKDHGDTGEINKFLLFNI